MNEKIILPDLINLLCEKQGMDKKEAELFVKTMFDLIKEALDKDKYVKIKGLGTFKLTEVGSRESVHVNTGERIEIQGHTKVSFTPDATMKDLINKPFAHFESVVLNDGVELEDTPIEAPEEPMIQEEVIVAPASVIEETPVAMEEAIAEEPATEEPIAEESIVEESTEETVVAEETIVETPAEEIIEEVVEEEVMEEVIPEAEVEQPVEDTPMEEHQPEITETKEEPAEKPVFIEEKVASEEVKKEKNINRILWGVIVVLVLIILFGAYWMFFRPTETSEVTPAPSVQEEAAITQVEDSANFVVLGNSEPPIYMQPLKLTPEELRKERVPALADTLEYLINGSEPICEHALKSGETIIRISVWYYGSKRFWPYIAKFNSDNIKDPDNIPIGTIIKIPAIIPKEWTNK